MRLIKIEQAATLLRVARDMLRDEQTATLLPERVDDLMLAVNALALSLRGRDRMTSYPVFDGAAADMDRDWIAQPIGEASSEADALAMVNASFAKGEGNPPTAASMELNGRHGVTGWFVATYAETDGEPLVSEAERRALMD